MFGLPRVVQFFQNVLTDEKTGKQTKTKNDR